MHVVAFAPYPERGPSTWFRLAQFREPLAQRGIELDIEPFLDPDDYASLYERDSRATRVQLLVRGWRRRWERVASLRREDLVVIQRELAPVLAGPLLSRVRSRSAGMLYDFDDALYLPGPGRDRVLGTLRRPGADTTRLCRSSDRVLAGNRILAEFARRVRASLDPASVEVLPSVVDTELYRPRPPQPGHSVPTLGWVGSHTSLPYLEALYPILAEVARSRPFRLRVVCNRAPANPPMPLQLDFESWTPARRVECIHDIDIGLYPLADDAWSRGKCGLKAIEYMACAVPVVCAPVGALREIVVDGVTGVHANSADEWSSALARLLDEGALRTRVGEAGRRHVVQRYSVAAVLDRWVGAVTAVAERGR